MSTAGHVVVIARDEHPVRVIVRCVCGWSETVPKRDPRCDARVIAAAAAHLAHVIERKDGPP